jgi:acyl-coenzyme A synthetase/AMP-(fatty) acid ligase
VNLAEQALRSCRAPGHESVPAFLTSEGPVSRAEFKNAVLAVIGGLKTLGLAPGEKVLLRMMNSVEFAAGFLGSVWAGMIPVLQNFQFGLSELEHIVALSRPTAILYASRAEERDPFLELAVGAARVVVTRRGLQLPSGQLVEGPTASDLEPFDAQADDLAFVVFTSGTTGKPKGVMHAHRWLTALGDSNRARVPPQRGDVVLATGEWSFISALGHNVLFPLRNGMTGSIMEERASPERILATIERDTVTLVHSVATLYRRILASPGIEVRFDLSSLRGANSTGEPLEEYVRDEWRRRIGCPIWEHYGISEAQMVLGDGPRLPGRSGSVGKSWGARAAIVGPDLSPLPTNTVGTLAFDASYAGFFLGYLGDNQRTRETLRDGWFVTSDLARIDDEGYVYILGRLDDCFKSKGVLIVPSEVEQAILALGAFQEACVFPVPDKEIGNRIGVAIVPRHSAPDELLHQSGLAHALDGSIAPFKVPHIVLAVDELPKNANGKTQRSAVVRLLQSRGVT